MRATDKTHRPIYMTAAMVMTVLLAVTVLLAQDNPEEVILKEEFQALLLASADQGDATAQLISVSCTTTGGAFSRIPC